VLINDDENQKYIIPNGKNPEALTARDIPSIIKKTEAESNRIKKVSQKAAAKDVITSDLIKPSIRDILGLEVSADARTSARTEVLLIKKDGVPFKVYEPGTLRRGTYKDNGSIVYYSFDTPAAFFGDYSRNFGQFTDAQKKSKIDAATKRRVLAGTAVKDEKGNVILDTRGNVITTPVATKEEETTKETTLTPDQIVEMLSDAFGTGKVSTAEKATEEGAEKKAPAVITVERTFVKPKTKSPIVKVVKVQTKKVKGKESKTTKLVYSINGDNLTISRQPAKGTVLIEKKYTSEEFEQEVDKIQALVDSGALDIADDQKTAYVAKVYQASSLQEVMDEETDLQFREIRARAAKERVLRQQMQDTRQKNEEARVNPENVPAEIMDAVGGRSTMTRISLLDDNTRGLITDLLVEGVDGLLATPRGQSTALNMVQWISSRLNNELEGKSIADRLKQGMQLLIEDEVVPYTSAQLITKSKQLQPVTIGDIHSLLFTAYQNTSALTPQQLGFMNELDKKKKSEAMARLASRYSAFVPAGIQQALNELSEGVIVDKMSMIKYDKDGALNKYKVSINLTNPSGREIMSAVVDKSMDSIIQELTSAGVADYGDVVILKGKDGQPVGSEFRFFHGMSSLVRGALEDAIQERLNEASLRDETVIVGDEEDGAVYEGHVKVSYDDIAGKVMDAYDVRDDIYNALDAVNRRIEETLRMVDSFINQGIQEFEFENERAFTGSEEDIDELVNEFIPLAVSNIYDDDVPNSGIEGVASYIITQIPPNKLKEGLEVVNQGVEYNISPEKQSRDSYNAIQQIINAGEDFFMPMAYNPAFKQNKDELYAFDRLFDASYNKDIFGNTFIEMNRDHAELEPFVSLDIPGNTELTGENFAGAVISGSFAHVNTRQLTKSLTPKIGKKFGSIKDVAEIFSFMRSNRASFSAIVALKENMIIDYTVFTELSNESPSMSYPAMQYQKMVDSGVADSFMMVHSHTDGSAYPSDFDIKMGAQASGLRSYAGSIVLGVNNFSYVPVQDGLEAGSFAVAGYRSNPGGLGAKEFPSLATLSKISGKFAASGDIAIPSLIVDALSTNVYGGIQNSYKNTSDTKKTSIGLVYLREDRAQQYKLLGTEFVLVNFANSGELKNNEDVANLVAKANVAKGEYGATNVVAVMPRDPFIGNDRLADVLSNAQSTIDHIVFTNNNNGAHDEYNVIPVSMIDIAQLGSRQRQTTVVNIKKAFDSSLGIYEDVPVREAEQELINKYGITLDDESVQIEGPRVNLPGLGETNRVYNPSTYAVALMAETMSLMPEAEIGKLLTSATFSIADIQSTQVIKDKDGIIPAIKSDVASAIADITGHSKRDVMGYMEQTKVAQESKVSQVSPIRMSAYVPSQHPFAQKMNAESKQAVKTIKKSEVGVRASIVETLADRKASIMNFIVKNNNASSSMAGKLLEAFIRTESGKSISAVQKANEMSKFVFGKPALLVANNMMREVRDVLRARTIVEIERRRQDKYQKMYANKQAALANQTIQDIKAEFVEAKSELSASKSRISKLNKKIAVAMASGDVSAQAALSAELQYENQMQVDLIDSASKLKYRIAVIEGTTRDLRDLKDPLINPMGQTLDEANDFLATRGSESPESFQYANEVVDRMFQVSAQIMKEKLDAGLISQAQHDALADYGYSPRIVLERLVDRETLRATGALTQSSASGLKTLKNGTDLPMVQDPDILFRAMVLSHEKAILRNEIKKRLYNYVKSANANEDVKIEEPKKIASGPRAGQYATTKFGTYIYERKAEAGSTVIEFYDNAQVYRMRASNTFFARWQGLQSWGGDGYMMDVLGYASGSRIVKKFATVVNPSFAVVNIVRDVIFVNGFTDVFGKTLTTSTLRYLKNVPPAFIASIKKDGLYEKARTGGFEMNFLVQDSVEVSNIKKQIEKRTGSDRANKFKYAMDILGTATTKIQEVSEVMTRLAIFNQAYNDLVKANPTLTEAELQTLAAAKSREHLDYAISGKASGVIENLLPYTNAAMRALETTAYYVSPKAGNSLFGNRVQESNEIVNASSILKIAEFCLGYAAIMMFNNAIGEPEEEFDSKGAKNIHDLDYFSPDIKERNLLILTGRRFNRITGKVAQPGDLNTVPEALSFGIPYELTPFVRLTQEMISNTAPSMSDRHPENLKSALTLGAEYYIPLAGKGISSGIEQKDPTQFITGVIGSVPSIAAYAAYALNIDTYTGEQAFRNRFGDLAPEDMYDNQTRATYVKLGKEYGLKPKQLQVAAEKILTRADNNYFLRIGFDITDNMTYESLIESGVVEGSMRPAEELTPALPVQALVKRTVRQGNENWLTAYRYDNLELSVEENQKLSRARLDVKSIARRWNIGNAKENAKEFTNYVTANFDPEKSHKDIESLSKLYMKEIQIGSTLSPDAQNVARTQDSRQKAELLTLILDKGGEGKFMEVLSQIYQYEQLSGTTVMNEEVAGKFGEYWNRVKAQ
jgi:proteasome lid subunit RPN8/RPN11